MMSEIRQFRNANELLLQHQSRSGSGSALSGTIPGLPSGYRHTVFRDAVPIMFPYRPTLRVHYIGIDKTLLTKG